MIYIKQATSEDAPILNKLAHEIWHLHYPGIISIEQIDYMLNVGYTPQAIRNEIGNDVCWFIIKTESSPIGFFSVAPRNNSVWKLEKIYIHPSAHNKGIGKQAFRFIKEFLKQKGASKLILNVNRKNRNSIEAYLRFGLKIAFEEDTYIGPFLLDDYVMELNL